MSKISPKIKIKKDTYESKILDFLSQFTYLTLDAFAPKQYSYTRLFRDTFGLDGQKLNSDEIQRYKRIISCTLTRLKQKGLLVKENKTKGVIWKLIKNKKEIFCPVEIKLPPEDDKIRLFIFDIPKAKKHYRNWIREQLISADYKMLQKSVWVGKRPLRSDFLEELAEKKLFDNIHLFEIKEVGTLSNWDL